MLRRASARAPLRARRCAGAARRSSPAPRGTTTATPLRVSTRTAAALTSPNSSPPTQPRQQADAQLLAVARREERPPAARRARRRQQLGAADPAGDERPEARAGGRRRRGRAARAAGADTETSPASARCAQARRQRARRLALEVGARLLDDARRSARPTGQALSQARQPRQRSRCRTTSASSAERAVLERADEVDAAARRVPSVPSSR